MVEARYEGLVAGALRAGRSLERHAEVFLEPCDGGSDSANEDLHQLMVGHATTNVLDGRYQVRLVRLGLGAYEPQPPGSGIEA